MRRIQARERRSGVPVEQDRRVALRTQRWPVSRAGDQGAARTTIALADSRDVIRREVPRTLLPTVGHGVARSPSRRQRACAWRRSGETVSRVAPPSPRASSHTTVLSRPTFTHRIQRAPGRCLEAVDQHTACVRLVRRRGRISSPCFRFAPCVDDSVHKDERVLATAAELRTLRGRPQTARPSRGADRCASVGRRRARVPTPSGRWDLGNRDGAGRRATSVHSCTATEHMGDTASTRRRPCGGHPEERHP